MNRTASFSSSTFSHPTSTRLIRASRLLVVLVLLALLRPSEGTNAADVDLSLSIPTNPPQTATPVLPNTALLQPWLSQVDPDRLEAHINTLQGFITRHVNSFNAPAGTGISAARDYIRAQFNAISAADPECPFFVSDNDFEVSYYGVNSTATNIVAVQPGTDPDAGVIVVGAHYDSITTDWGNGTVPAPGADDNASGVAALLELARILGCRNPQPRATVIFVAFSAEEAGRLGSIAFVNTYEFPNGVMPTAMIDLDIIGSSTGPNGALNDTQIRLFSAGPNDSPSRQLARSLQFINVLYPHQMEILLQDGQDRPGRYGDHFSFNEVGCAAVRFIEPLEDTNHQHSQSDLSSDIQIPYLTRSTQTVLASLVALAQGPHAPTNLSLDTSGQIPGLSWNSVTDAVSYVVALRLPGSLSYDEQFEVSASQVQWDGFTSTRYAAVAVAAKDVNGLIGPLSGELLL